MIKIKKEIVEAIHKQGKNELPNEACGYLAAKDGVIVKAFPMTNADKSPEHFSFIPKEQFDVVRKAREEGLEMIAIYHTHPATPARMSNEDIRLAYDTNTLYVIYSLKDNDIKCFSTDGDKKIKTIDLEVI